MTRSFTHSLHARPYTRELIARAIRVTELAAAPIARAIFILAVLGVLAMTIGEILSVPQHQGARTSRTQVESSGIPQGPHP